MEIGRKLKEARTASGLSQEKVAEKIKVSRQTISNWETEKRRNFTWIGHSQLSQY